MGWQARLTPNVVGVMSLTNDEGSRGYRVPDEYARAYLQHAAGLKLSPDSATTYESHLRGYVMFLHDRGIVVLDASFTDVISFVEACVRRKNRQSTIEGKVATIGELYKYIRLRTEVGQELELEPLRLGDIDVGQYRTPEPIERVALSRTELRQLFDAFGSYRNRLIAVVAVETALRNSDLRTIKTEDVDLEELEIHVPDPKGSRAYDVPISEALATELEFWIRHHRGGYATAAESPYLFPSERGECLETNGSLNRIVQEAADKSGIQDTLGQSALSPEQQEDLGLSSSHRQWHRVTPHTLRHSCLTLMKDDGVSLSYRQLVANHASPETTRMYTHGTEDKFASVRANFNPPR